MKIICNRNELSEAFSLAASVAPAKSPKEILRNVKFVAQGGVLVLMATDTEIGIRVELPESDSIEIVQEGEAVLPVARTRSILRDSDAVDMEIEADDQGALIRGGRSKFKLASESPQEFPSVKEFAAEKYHEIPARLFREMIRRTIFACDEASKQYALGGVLFELEGDTVRGCAADGRRLAVMEGKGESIGRHQTGELTTIVPQRAAKIIEQSLSDGEQTVQVSEGLSEIFVKTSRASISARLLSGRFPRWSQIMPDEDDAHRVDILAGHLQSAVRQAAVVTDFESRAVDFTFDEGVLRLEANTATVGESSVEVPIAYDGAPVVLTMDHNFVAQFCGVLDPETPVVIELMETKNRPVLFRTSDGYRYVIMPMHRNE